VGNGQKEGEEERGREALNFDVKMIALSCLLIQKNTVLKFSDKVLFQ